MTFSICCYELVVRRCLEILS